MKSSKWIKWGLVGSVAVLLLIQLIPYGRAHDNPPVLAEPAWDSPSTRSLAVRACYDCHSNETVWPWYTNVAPFSWLVQHDVDEGREKLNFSEWGDVDVDELAEAVLEGEMPPFYYGWMHSAARLGADEKTALAGGLEATAGRR